MKKQLGKRYPEITWTREDEVHRKVRMKLYYDLIEYHNPEISNRIIQLHDHKGLLTVTINNKSASISKEKKELIYDFLEHMWEQAFNELHIEIVYDEGTNN